MLSAVAERDAYANLLLPALLRERGLTGRDAALATELAYGVLRGQGSYDAIIAICSDRDLDRVDPPLRQVLRLGAHQLLATRIGAARRGGHVGGPGQGRGRPAPGRVRQRGAAPGRHPGPGVLAGDRRPGRAGDLVGHLSVRYSHPRWIVTALSEALGEDPAGGLAETEAAARRGRRAPAGQPLRRARPGRTSRSWWPAGPRPPAGPRSARTWRKEIRGGSPPSRRAGRPFRTRPASSRRSRWPGRTRAERSPGPARVARHLRRARRQGPAAGRAGPGPRGPPARRRPAPAPRPAVPRRDRRPRGHRRRGGGRDRAGLAARCLRPGSGRRPVLGSGRAAPPGRGALAPLTRGRCRAGPAAARPAGRGPGLGRARAESSPTSPAPRTWPKPATS